MDQQGRIDAGTELSQLPKAGDIGSERMLVAHERDWIYNTPAKIWAERISYQ